MLILYGPQRPQPSLSSWEYWKSEVRNIVGVPGNVTQTQSPIPNPYPLLIYIPALAQIARKPLKLPPPSPVTLNSAADVVQNAMLGPTWDLKGCWTAFSSHHWWFQGVPEVRFGVSDMFPGLKDVARRRRGDPRCHLDRCKSFGDVHRCSKNGFGPECSKSIYQWGVVFVCLVDL